VLGWKKTKVAFIPDSVAPGCLVLFFDIKEYQIFVMDASFFSVSLLESCGHLAHPESMDRKGHQPEAMTVSISARIGMLQLRRDSRPFGGYPLIYP
jgi:hypothetical protein